MVRPASIFLTCLALALAQDQQRPVFRSEANFVTVDAYPIRDGKVVTGLTAADFEVLEDGAPQKIEAFEFFDGSAPVVDATRRDPATVRESNLLAADARTRAFVVYLDLQHVSVSGARATRVPLITMLNRLIGPTDLFAVLTTAQPPTHLTFARKTITVEDMLARNWAWGMRDTLARTPLESMLEECFPHDARGQQGWVRDGQVARPLSDVLIDRAREEHALQSLEDLVLHLSRMREGRTSVVLFTEGWRLFDRGEGLIAEPGQRRPAQCDQELMRLSNAHGPSRLRNIISMANRSNVTFYTVNPTGLAVFDWDISQQVLATGKITESPIAQGLENIRDRVEGMQTLAENTDGFAVVNTNDLKKGLERVTNELASYYLLGYYSTNTKFDGKLRRIKVNVKQPGVDVKARRGYLAPTEAERAAMAAPSIAAKGPTAVESALDVLARLRPTAELFVHAARSPTRVTTFVEVSGSQMEQGALARGGTLSVVVATVAGAEVASAQATMAVGARSAAATVDLPPDAPAGPLRVTARIRAEDRTLEARIDVRAEGGKVLGMPLVYRATPSARSPLVPVAGYQFRRTERVHVEWPVRMPLDRREARLLGRGGQPIAASVTVTEREVDGITILSVDALLAPLAPGDYVLEVIGASGGETETVLIAIRVVN